MKDLNFQLRGRSHLKLILKNIVRNKEKYGNFRKFKVNLRGAEIRMIVMSAKANEQRIVIMLKLAPAICLDK